MIDALTMRSFPKQPADMSLSSGSSTPLVSPPILVAPQVSRTVERPLRRPQLNDHVYIFLCVR